MEYLPTAHVLQTDESEPIVPLPEVDEPAAQSVHAPLPSSLPVAEYLPTAHYEHEAIVFLVMEGLL